MLLFVVLLRVQKGMSPHELKGKQPQPKQKKHHQVTQSIIINHNSPQAPVHAHLERRLEARDRRRDDALAAHADGDVVEERLRELLLDGPDLGLGEVGAQQAHAALGLVFWWFLCVRLLLFFVWVGCFGGTASNNKKNSSSRTLMSKPTPPGDTTASGSSMSNAATLPIAKP